VIIDVNVYLSRWPCRRLPLDETPRLVERMKKLGIGQAWVGSFDALLHRDIEGVNARLAAECAAWPAGLLVPFGAVNPMLPDWREDVRRCHEVYHMPGVRLHPNYHGYTLDDPICDALLQEAEARDLIVQLPLVMDDDRVRHPLLRVENVDSKPLPALIKAHPQLRFVILNGTRGGRPAAPLAGEKNVFYEFAMLEGVAGIEKLLRDVRFPVEQLLFGSHCPWYNLDSAVLKLQESELTGAQREAITHGNARRLLATGAGR